ncbi:CAP domain-containing protein [Niveispirillum sp. KHB5.9]|uniref:CAP domain-containing protein n=1 Tax=Niveispirillum sp. KHB5.9 TaxID=3400269 RepID=UPI003A85937E
MLTALALLATRPVQAADGDSVPLLRANSLPLDRVGPYAATFADFRRQAGERSLLTTAEMAALKATGEIRLGEGASFLRDDADLGWIARHYAAQLAAGAPFGHQDAGGRHAADRIALLHRRMVGVNGENLYASSAFDPDRPEAAGRLAVDNLMQSPGHRSNILDPRWTHAGFGAAVGQEGFMLVQLFAERAALLMADMPVTVPAGAPLPAGSQQAADGAFSGLALVPLARQVSADDFARPGSLQAPAGKGLHRSFFARTQEKTERTAKFTIHPGPMILVT